jgi:hypothetical protein
LWYAGFAVVSEELVMWITESGDFDWDVYRNDLQLKILLRGYIEEENSSDI